MQLDKVESVSDREDAEALIERVAVIFTHGQGEQTPMQDVIELAKAIWTRSAPVVAAGVESGVWSVPVYDADMSEQRRIVTALFPKSARGNGASRDLQVDFYQFYWADLMSGNRFFHLWNWFLALMRRNPAETPTPLRPIRQLAMRGAFMIGGLGVLYGLLTTVRLATVDILSWANLYALLMAVALVATGVFLAQPRRRVWALYGGLALTAASLALGFAVPDLLHDKCQLVEWMATGKSALGCKGVASGWPVFGRPWIATAAASGHSLLAGMLLVVAAASAALIAYVYQSFLIPVMTDSARLLSSTPENIPNRDRIRKRGMDLLEALHASDRRYDRIVMVAHSLGTVVAYNVLCQYWGNVYRLYRHTATQKERLAVEQAGQALDNAPPGTQAATLAAFRAAVRAYFKGLCDPKSELPSEDVEWRTAEYTSPGRLLRMILRGREKPESSLGERFHPPWLVSDFITLGSPMTYASLLMAASDADFQAQCDVRRYAQCPPALSKAGSFSHRDQPHHAALFGVTCWTNFYFKTEGLVAGDIIGGPIAAPPPRGLGRGVLDIETPRDARLPHFAHNEYWKWQTAFGDERPEHIALLGHALNLFDDPRADSALIAAARFEPRLLADQDRERSA